MVNIQFDMRVGTGAPAEVMYGEVLIEATAGHNNGDAFVLPAPTTVTLINGLGVAPNVQESPAGDNPGWAYKVLIKREGGGAWAEIVRVPSGTGDVAYTSLERLSTPGASIPLTTWDALLLEATEAKEASIQAAADAETAQAAAVTAAGLVGAPAGAAVLAAVSEGGAARDELNAAIVDEGADHFSTRDPKTFYAKDYGLVADGVTDDSDAFIALHASVRAAIQDSATGASNKRGKVRIVLPPGRIKLTKANAMMNAVSGTRTEGLAYEGAGRFLTEILFQPSAAGTALMRNNDVWLGVTWRGITFISQTAGSRFLHSSSNGGAQDYLFEDCSWSGTWEFGVGLDGTSASVANNNSEFQFLRCTVGGKFTTGFLWSGMTAGNTQQDQFLNYTFDACNVFLLTGGTFLRFDYGGAIHIRAGNIIADQGATVFDLRGNSHAYGVEQFDCIGTRIELRNDACRTISCAWGRGTVSFTDVNEEADIFYVPDTTVTHSYRPGSAGGPVVRYQSCALAGKHEYGYDTGSWDSVKSVTYDGCWLPNEPHNFILHTFTGTGVDNKGGRSAISFRRVKSRTTGGSTALVLDQTYGWHFARASQPERRAAVFRTGLGTLPAASAGLKLPMNAVITGARFYKRGGVGTNATTGWSYTVQTTETTPTVLATASGGGTLPWNAGFSKTVAVENFVADSDTKRTLTLVAAGIDQEAAGMDGWVVVEFLA